MLQFKIFRIVLICIMLSVFSTESHSRDLEEILKSGVIYIGFDESEIGSINYKMAYDFADYLNLEVKEVIVDWERLFSKNGVRPEDLETNPKHIFTPDAFDNIDIYCGNVTPMEWRRRLFDFAPTLISAEVVVGKIDSKHKISGINDLNGLKLAMMAGTSFVSRMKEINDKIGGGITLVETTDAALAKQKLKNDEVDGIILDGPEALAFMSEFPGVYKIKVPINSTENLVWAVEKGNVLKLEVANFLDYIKSNGRLDRLFDFQYGISYQDFENLLETHTPVKIKNRDLKEILAEKKIVVSFREREFVYKKDGAKQFVQILAEEFADYLGVELEYVIVPSFNDYWKINDTIIKDSVYTPEIFNHFDLACDIFAPLPWRSNKVDLVKVYQSTYDVLARKSSPITSLSDLKNFKGAVAKNTVYYEMLTDAGASDFYFTSINDMVDAVRTGKADYTLIYNSFLYPDLSQKLSLGVENICWGMRYNQPELRKALEMFIEESSKNGLLKALDAVARGEITTTNIEDYLKFYYSSSQKGTLPHIIVDANEGLPQEDVNCIFQDEKGFLWFGTKYGLVSYNGKRMQKFHTGNGLNSNLVNDIAQGVTGEILVATDKGLSVIRDNKVVNYEKRLSILNIFKDLDGRIWLKTPQGLGIFADGKLTFETSLSVEKIGVVSSFQRVPDSSIYLIATTSGLYLKDKGVLKLLVNEPTDYALIDSQNKLWYSTSRGIFYSEKGLQNMPGGAVNVNPETGIPMSQIRKISESYDGSIWFQNTNNLYQLTSIDQPVIVFSSGKDLINNTILSFLQDAEQNIWIGYSGGLQKIRNNKSLRNFYVKELDYYISAIVMDDVNNIWITSNNGLFFYDNKNANLQKNPEISNMCIVRQYNDNQLIIADETGLFQIVDNGKLIRLHNLNLKGLNGMIVNSLGQLFIWTNDGKLYWFETLSSKPILISNAPEFKIENAIDFDGTTFMATINNIYRLENKALKKIFATKTTITGLGHSHDKLFYAHQNKLINVFDSSDFVVIQHDGVIVKNIIPSRNRSFVWVATNKGVFYINIDNGAEHLNITTSDGLQGNEIVNNGLYIDRTGILWIMTYHGISNYNLRSLKSVKYAPKCYLSQVIVNGLSVDSSTTVFSFNENDFVFQLAGLFFSNEKSIEFEYYLRGEKNAANFIRTTRENVIYYDNLEPGDYQLVFRAKGEDDIWSESKTYKFKIKKAFWNTWFFRIAVVTSFILIVILIYRWRMSRIKRQKQQLEKLVQERTEDLVEANKLVTAKNEEITASIHYAERIQQSLLPKEELFRKRFADHFIIFMPRDIVSGDFFWAMELRDKVYISAVDCTGHGVPGAFMSMLGMSSLKEIVSRSKQLKPGQILDELRLRIIDALQQEGKLGEAKDGMDMSLVCIDLKNNKLEFAGANNPIYILRKGELPIESLPEDRVRKRTEIIWEITPDKMPIAIYDRMDSYQTVEVSLLPNDQVYLFSDGFPDQFGGPNNKKLMYSRLRTVLEENFTKAMPDQKVKLMELFNDWKGEDDQVDDVTLIGLKIS
ncbi:MAG: transporter substrate-binding domain-containing protein [Bacteroidales bacterium]|nr:transporter substrate-binding domain-containing protein [Bacteroidales bacterium]